MRRTLVGLPSLALLGTLSCTNGHGKPGDELGTYAVVARLESSTCGEGALGASDPWEFQIELTRFENELFWLNGREDIAGTIAGDGVSFSFDTRVEAEALPAEKGRKACVLSRVDHAEGKLSSADTEVLAFSGELRFAFSEVEGSDCSPLIGIPGGFAELPCEMLYDPLEGMRVKAPEEN